MKKLLTLFLLTLACSYMCAQRNVSALIPMPNEITLNEGKPFQLNDNTKICIAVSKLEFEATTLQQIIDKYVGIKPVIVTSNGEKNCISLSLDNSIKGDEAYRLNVQKGKIEIAASTNAGILYGIMSLRQIILGDIASTDKKEIAPIAINDSPRFQRRALMLDPARNFIPVKGVKFYMDNMMKYKYNVLQLHLTDDQGWRMEIKGMPKLTADAPSYTQDELKELVEYGKKRNIEIVPELDIPGHTVAMLAAYPELCCTSNDTIKKDVGTTVNLMICSNNDATYKTYKEIIRQVAAVFPSQFIHLGGDEAVIEKNWGKCEKCKELMAQKGYTKASQLMIPFFEKMLSYVSDNGKRPILWCELDNIYMPANDYLFPYPKNVQLVSWRNGLTPKCIELTEKYGNDLMLAPGEYAYFDYPQLKGDLPEFNNWGMPVTILEKAYQFDPGYGLPEAKQKHIIGVMGTLWGEAIKDINRANYMTYPRALALAEAGWTNMSKRGWDSFKKRVYPNIMDLMESGVSVRAPYEIAK